MRPKETEPASALVAGVSAARGGTLVSPVPSSVEGVHLHTVHFHYQQITVVTDYATLIDAADGAAWCTIEEPVTRTSAVHLLSSSTS